MFGHNVSHANNKTKRTFYPNVHWVKLQSAVLKQTLSLKISTAGMKTVHKHGGIDQFLDKVSPRKLTGEMLRLKKMYVRQRRLEVQPAA